MDHILATKGVSVLSEERLRPERPDHADDCSLAPVASDTDSPAFVGDQTADDPQTETIPGRAVFVRLRDKTSCERWRQTWPIVTHFDDERVVFLVGASTLTEPPGGVAAHALMSRLSVACRTLPAATGSFPLSLFAQSNVMLFRPASGSISSRKSSISAALVEWFESSRR